MNIRQQQLKDAEALGKKAFHSGMRRICAMDTELEKMMQGRNIGETPEGEAKSTSIMESWCAGWDKANCSQIFRFE